MLGPINRDIDFLWSLLSTAYLHVVEASYLCKTGLINEECGSEGNFKPTRTWDSARAIIHFLDQALNEKANVSHYEPYKNNNFCMAPTSAVM